MNNNTNEIGQDYPLYITKPEAVNITASDFHALSYFGLASFLVSWEAVAEKTEDGYYIWGRSGTLNEFFDTKRFKDLKFWEYSEAEMTRIDVPQDHSVAKLIERKFKHRILK